MTDSAEQIDSAAWEATGLPPLADGINVSTKTDDLFSLFYSAAMRRVADARGVCRGNIRISFVFVDENDFGAWALPFASGYVVVAAAGTIASLVDFYARMFTYWECSDGNWREKAVDPMPSVLANPLEHWRRAAVIPSDGVTRIRAQILALHTFGFIIDHELAHIMYGHCDFNDGSSGCKTDSRISSLECRMALTSQALELHADRFAALKAIDSGFGLPDADAALERISPKIISGTPTEEYSKQIRSAMNGLTTGDSQRALSTILCIYCMFRLFDDHHWNKASLETASHPPGPFRFAYCKKIIAGMYGITRDKQGMENFRKADAKINEMGEAIFSASLGRAPDRAALAQSRSRTSASHYKKLLKHLDRVSHRLNRKY